MRRTRSLRRATGLSIVAILVASSMGGATAGDQRVDAGGVGIHLAGLSADGLAQAVADEPGGIPLDEGVAIAVSRTLAARRVAVPSGTTLNSRAI